MTNDTHDFQNFHRALCERFGYSHDPIDWRRDQVSLIEHIAKQVTEAVNSPAVSVLPMLFLDPEQPLGYGMIAGDSHDAVAELLGAFRVERLIPTSRAPYPISAGRSST